MLKLTAAQLGEPIQRVSRMICLAHIDDALSAGKRVAGGADVEALHDFRVALRRLRSALSSYRPWLAGTGRRRTRRERRRLADATNAARDAEVRLELLAALSGGPDHDGEAAERQLAKSRASQDLEAARRPARSAVRRFARVAPGLRKSLSTYRAPVLDVASEMPAAATAIAKVLAGLAGELGGGLRAIEGPADIAAAHAARIKAKHVRYLLEPLAGAGAEVAAATAELRELQDVLGRVHDLAGLRSVVEALPACGSYESPGAVAPLAMSLAALEAEAWDRFAGSWLGTRAAALCDALAALGQRLVSAAPGPHLEIERKYLLARLPDCLHGAQYQLISQGWLPGEVIQERLRRVRSIDGETWLRTVKAGTGVTRFELEEPVPRALWRSLWPFTTGRRIRKRRYEVRDGELTWQVDAFLDFNLCLAEVELPSEEATVVFPSWLASEVVSEVTGDPAYLNLRMALDGPPAPAGE